MYLVYLAALIAVCSAAKLDRTYLPPASAITVGGSPAAIQAPLLRDSISEDQGRFPNGAFDNDFDGVVVEAVSPGTRVSSPGETGLGAPRISYGSSYSKVGEAAFKPINQQGVQTQIASQFSRNFYQVPNIDFKRASGRPQAAADRASNIVRFQKEIRPKSYNYAFQTDNGITAEENGVTINGAEVQGGYSYTGDDGKLYKVTYTAGKGGYQPIGDHLPTSPPIPDEILKSLEQNAKEAAAGLVDDGSYDAAKYNAENDYTKSDNDYNKYKNEESALGKKTEFDADVSGTFVSQNHQIFEIPNVKEQLTPYFNYTPKDTNINNAFESYANINNKNEKTSGQQFSDITVFEPISTQNTLNQVNSNKNTHMEGIPNDDDFSRPIYFGSIDPNQALNKGFGIENSYLPPPNIQRQNFSYTPGVNAQNSTTQLNFKSSPNEHQDIKRNKSQQKVDFQFEPHSFLKDNFDKYSQISNSQSHDLFQNSFFNDIELNKNSNSQKQPNFSPDTFNNLQATFQPNTEITTPFVDSAGNIAFQKRNQKVPIPTQSSFLLVPTSNSQPHNVAHSNYERSNDNVNIQLNPIAPHQVSNGFQDISNKGVTKFNDKSQYQSSDHSYYYNQPSKPFEASYKNNEEALPNINSGSINLMQSSKNNFKNLNMQFQISNKYPRPPTIPSTRTSFSKISYNENVNTPHDVVSSQNGEYGASANYPKLPTIANITPSPSKSTDQDISRFLSHSTGITQASISPFPSLSSMTNFGPISNIKKPDNFRFNQDISQSLFLSPSTASPQENTLGQSSYQQSNNKLDQTDSHNNQGFVQQTTKQIIPQFNYIGNRPSEQYDGEVYEYKKPDDSFSTPSKSEKENRSLTENRFAEFGQKLQPSFIQRESQRENQNEYNNTSQIIFQEFQLNRNNIKKEQKPLGDSQISNFESSMQGTKFTSDAFTKSQGNKNYNVPFGFSDRVKPCCQRFQMPSQNTVQYQPDSNFRRFEMLKPLSTDFKPKSKEGISTTQTTGVQDNQGFQTAHTTSQLSQTGGREDFSGPQKSPAFDEASGYYY
ncbi:unnamed protein product [Parnassius apollo]|uniref:(apollo) hypothetical protein n=1 Tax=Parnassius apollo TaxID=110799 RepID=A0A8S3XHN8_PARAO|nr:unnamed protein product [Parnassius apollo]